MKVVVTAEARAFRRAVGVTAWAVLEELVLDADRDESGALVARTNVRRLAAHLGISKDTAARAVARLTRAEVVARVVAHGEHGALPTSSYVIDLARVTGLSVDLSPAITTAPSQPASRTRTRPTSLINHSQSPLFDLPATTP